MTKAKNEEVSLSRRRLLLGAGALVPSAIGCARSGSDLDSATLPPPRMQPETAAAALTELREGNHRFTTRQPIVRSTAEIEHIWTELALGQKPYATILGCADSRLAPELIFDQFFGDIFVVREAGNIAASPTNLGSLEYAQSVLGSKLLMVLGHSSCGAVKAAFEDAKPGGNIQAIVDKIKPSIADAINLDQAIATNVAAAIADIRRTSALLSEAEREGKIQIVGAIYSIETGDVSFMTPRL